MTVGCEGPLQTRALKRGHGGPQLPRSRAHHSSETQRQRRLFHDTRPCREEASAPRGGHRGHSDGRSSAVGKDWKWRGGCGFQAFPHAFIHPFIHSPADIGGPERLMNRQTEG